MRYKGAKHYKRVDGSWAWGVFDTVSKTFVEGGFFSKGAADAAAFSWNRIDEALPNSTNFPGLGGAK